MIEVPVELLILPPLAMAAGVDLYLTLLFLGVAPATGLWPTPLPGALGDLGFPVVLVTAGALYIGEVVAERSPPAALAWNAFHAVIRPVSGALLALLLLDAQPLPLVVVGVVCGGVLAWATHAVRTGAWALRALSDADGPSPALVSAAEDAVVVGTVSLSLDLPRWAFAASMLAFLTLAPLAPSRIRAFVHAIRLGIDRVFRTVGLRRWRRGDELPPWIGPTLQSGEQDVVHVGTVRGCPAGAWRLEDAPLFTAGWIVVRDGRPFFLYRTRKHACRVDLGQRRAVDVRDRNLCRRIELAGDGAPAFLLVGWSGPSTESLAADFPA